MDQRPTVGDPTAPLATQFPLPPAAAGADRQGDQTICLDAYA